MRIFCKVLVDRAPAKKQDLKVLSLDRFEFFPHLMLSRGRRSGTKAVIMVDLLFLPNCVSGYLVGQTRCSLAQSSF